jgi:hypothetical protein
MAAVPRITGAGGGKGGGGGQELPDSLRSTQVADVLDLLHEGEGEGLVNGLQSIYLDGVPLQNADGTFNFTGVQVQLTPGTQGQPAIAGADGVQNELGVGVTVLAATPVVRNITNPAVDTVRVTIAVPQLSRQDRENGDLVGSSFEYAIDVQSNGGGYVEVVRDVVDGKTTSRYTRSKTFALSGAAPWQVRVRRITPDSTSALEVNAFRWSSYAEIQSLKLRYPNSVLVRIRVGAEQFGRIPTRAYDMMLQRIRVPTNYDPIAKTYTGVWDGTFKVAWTDCPPWHFFDMVTSNRYGLGRYFTVGESLKWELYRIGRYCDEMVPDGKGGMEPRFRGGVYLQTREQAYKVLQDLAAVFRGMCFFMGTDVGVSQDAPGEPVVQFTAANTVGRFNYSGASHSKRHTQVVVWFNSREELGKLVPEVVVNRQLQARKGIKSLELSPLGVWSRGQAHRLGKWALYSEEFEGQVVTHRSGLDGVQLRPGALYEIADPEEAGVRFGGRVRSATTGAVTLDAPVTLAGGETYVLGVALPDPANPGRLVIEKRPVTNAAGTHQVLTVVPAFSQAPAAPAVWVLEGTDVAVTTWRCLSVAPVDGTNEFEISGIRHHAPKHALIEQGIQFETPSVSRIPRVPPAPASIAFTESVVALGLERRIRVTVSWPEPGTGFTYLAAWRLNAGPWVDLQPTTANCVEIDGLVPGPLQVLVKSRNALGALSPARSGSVTLTGSVVAVGANLIDPTWWRPGAAWEWAIAENVANENGIIWGPGPRGGVQALWACGAGGTTTPDADGGWIGEDPNLASASPKNLARVDPRRTYRFAVPVQRVSGTGTLVWGPGAQLAAADAEVRVCALNTTTPVREPGFWVGDLPQVGRWYLLVGFVFPAGSMGVPADAGGVFDMASGQRVASTISYCWSAGATNVRTRAFQALASPLAEVRWAPPAVELVDGTEGAWTAGPPGADGADGEPGAGSVTLIPRGNVVLTGPAAARKVGGVNAWDSDLRTLESFIGAAWCSFQPEQNNLPLMMGLNSDPAVAADFANIDFAWYLELGVAMIFESGAYVLTHGAYSSASVCSIVYDGVKVQYLFDGVVAREVSVAAGLRLYLDSSFWAPGAAVRNVRFGPAGPHGAPGAAGSTGNFIDHVWRRAAARPETPAGNGTPAGWSDEPPADDGNPLWLAVAEKTAASVLVGAWAVPQRVNGEDGDGLDIQYSVDGAANWHVPFAPGDLYARQRVGTTGPYTAAFRIVGERGAAGAAGVVHIKYSNDGGVTFTGSGGEDVGSWLGQYTDFSLDDSTNTADYRWKRIEGAAGPAATLAAAEFFDATGIVRSNIE